MKRRRRTHDGDVPLVNFVAYLDRRPEGLVDVLGDMVPPLLNLLGDHEAKLQMFDGPFERPRVETESNQRLRLADAEEVVRSKVRSAKLLPGLFAITTHVLPRWSWGYSDGTEPFTPKDKPAETTPGRAPTCHFMVYLDVLDDPKALAQGPVALACQELCRVLDRTGVCWYALMDCDYAVHTEYGHHYSAGGPQNLLSWRRRVEHRDWYDHALKPGHRRYIRAPMSWGHYLGPELAQRLDPRGDFVSRFNVPRGGSVPSRDSRPPVVEKFPGGGLFLTVGPNPLDCLEPDTAPHQTNNSTRGPQIEHAIWLLEEFRAAGVM